jgi:hypothetical protein
VWICCVGGIGALESMIGVLGGVMTLVTGLCENFLGIIISVGAVWNRWEECLES